jgi:exopolysaccharide biosynthesis polyprenyl glycosylphosphotransferase
MKTNASLVYALLLVIGDFLALMAAFTVAYILRVKVDPRPLVEQIPAMTFFYTALTVVPLWILVNAFLGLYGKDIYEKRFSEFGRLLVGSFIGILVVIGYDFVSNEELFPARLVPVYGLVLGFGFLLFFRTLARLLRKMLFRFGIGISNVLIVGDTDASEEITNALWDTKNTGQKVLGIVGREKEHVRHFAAFSEATDSLRSPIHAIIQTELYKDQDKNNEILKFAQEKHVSYRFVPGNTDLFVGNIDVELFAGLPVVAVHQTALIGWGRIVKRLFDLSLSILLLVVTSPIILAIAILIKISEPRGKVFFRQVRLTRYNREFRVFKFRTQYSRFGKGSQEDDFALLGRPDLAKKYRENGDFLENDPRITPVGKFLRSTSLDELPQLFNVIKGDISLVGPRALIPYELNAYEKKHAILSVKAGVTGLAQVSGRKDIDFEERRKLDIYYVQNWSFWGDIVILIKTFRVIIAGNSN